MKVLWVLVLSFLCTSSVLAIEDMGTPVTFQDAATATGSGTAMRVRGYVSVGVQVTISGTSATVTFQGSSDGSTYDTVSCTATNGGLNTGTATATGLYQCNVGSLSYFRANITACSSCTVTVTGQPSTAVASISSSRATASVISSGGVPTNGFQVDTFATSGNNCRVNIAGGDIGATSTANGVVGSAVDIACPSTRLGGGYAGNYFRITDTDVGGTGARFEVLSVRGNNWTFANGIEVQQNSYSTGQPNPAYYSYNFVKTNNSGNITFPGIGAITDVPSTTIPVASFWGMAPAIFAHSTSIPPIYLHYGSTWINSALYSAAYGTSQLDGTLIESLEDNGNHFSNQLPRTTAAYTNATTTLGIVTTASGGTLVVPVKNGRTYSFHANIFYSASSTGGIKLGVNSSTTASAIVYQVTCLDNTGTAILFATQVTALGSSAGANSGGAITGFCTIDGTATMSAGSVRILAADAASGNATMTMASTTGLAVGQLITQEGVDCDVIPSNTYLVSFVADTSATMSRNAACNGGASTRYRFEDTLWIEAADNSAAGTLTIAQGSSFEVKGSINGGTY